MAAITITDLNNAKLDVDHIAAVATSVSATATDRLGHVKPTISAVLSGIEASAAVSIAGIDTVADASIASINSTTADAIANIAAESAAVISGLGYLPPVTYAAAISLTLATQTVQYAGNTYAPKPADLPLRPAAHSRLRSSD